MNLALLWCWKEWRAQRGLLSAYLLLVFASLCCVFLLVSDQFWERTGGAHVIGWFIAAGVIGVVAFAVPQLVRGEFGTREDTFVRRLPGALWPAFRGKLLFVVLIACALPLMGLVFGELFLTATHHSWDDLFGDRGNAWSDVCVHWPEIVVYAAWAMVLVPWVWVLGTWLPGGRMAIGGTALLALVLGLGVFAVLRRCEGLSVTLSSSWQPWAYAAVPFGVLVAGMSWVRGRRGGGNYRSARAGLPVFALGLVAPASWLGSWAYEYHHPDLEHTPSLWIEGLSPDLRHAVGRATSDENWYPVPVRIDLETGAIEQLGGVYTTSVERELLRPSVQVGTIARQRYWHVADWDRGVHEVLDLDTGQRRAIDYDLATYRALLPADLRAAVEAEICANPLLQAPDGVRVAALEGKLLFTRPDGIVRSETWPVKARTVWRAGHGISAFVGKERCLYDLTRLQIIAPPGMTEPGGFAVRGIWLLGQNDSTWRRYDPESNTLELCKELQNCGVLGLLDDDRVLCQRRQKRNRQKALTAPELFLYRPAAGTVTTLQLPQELRTGCWDFWLDSPFVQDSPALRGRLQVLCRGSARGQTIVGWLRIDRTSLAMELKWRPPDIDWRTGSETLAMADDGALLLLVNHKQVVRLDETGARTVLFPRLR